MGSKVDSLSRWFAELKRRRVFRTVAAYLVVGWLLLQVADATFEPMGFPVWAQRALILAVAAGLVPVAVLAWVYDIRAGTIVRTDAAAPAAEAPRSSVASVAVLPFADLTSAKGYDWFCDGLAEEIIDGLCCVRGLRVASRTASFRFRDGSVDPREIGRLLSVDAVLEGSLRKAGERVKITAQLIDTGTGYHLWSETYERSFADVFAIQREIATHVAKALKLSLQGSVAGRFERYAPRRVEAYEYYLRGRQLMAQTNQRAWAQALAMFRRAIELDADYASAHAGLADCLAQHVLWRFLPLERNIAEATAAASRALDLAPDLAEAHVAQGHLRSLAGDGDGAVRSFERAIALNPELFEAYYYFGRHCFAHGDFARAAELYLAAHRVRPDDNIVLALAVNALDAGGDATRALETARRAAPRLLHQAGLEPDNARLQYMTAQTLLRLGETERGRPFVESALKLRGDEFATLYNAACFYSVAGEIDRALDLLEQAIRTGAGYPDWIRHDPDLAALAAHPRFQRLVGDVRAASAATD
jgi:TolB-like protein